MSWSKVRNNVDSRVYPTNNNIHSGSLIQVIEYETENASKNVDKGADELEKARELQIKALKKKTYILIILLIVLGNGLIDFLLFFFPNSILILFHFRCDSFDTFDNIRNKLTETLINFPCTKYSFIDSLN